MVGFRRLTKVRLLTLLLIGIMVSITYLTYMPIRPVKAVAPTTDGNIIWAQTSNHSGYDEVGGVAVDGTGVYVVGYDNTPGNLEWRVEKHSLSSGAVIWTQTSNPAPSNDRAYGVAVDATGLYVVGSDSPGGILEWRMEKRTLTTGKSIWNQTEPVGNGAEAWGVAVDGTGLYVVGYDSFGNGEWRVEKRSLTSGAVIWTQVENPTTSLDQAQGVAVDGTGVYVVGWDGSAVSEEMRIEKRSLTTGALITAFGTGGIITESPSGIFDTVNGVAVDGTGMYLVGLDDVPGNYEWRVEKRSLTTGALITAFGANGVVTSNPSGGDDEAYGVAVDATGLFVVGFDSFPGNFESRIEKRSLTTGALITTFGTGGIINENPGGGGAWIQAVAVDGTGVYLVGTDGSPGVEEWRVEKRNPGIPLWVVPITLYGGWNLISLPVVPISSKPSDVFAPLIADGTVKVVWSYTGTPSPSWKMYDAKKNSGPLAAISDGMGLWVYMTAADTLNVEGYVITPAGSPHQYSLIKGWNLVGYKPQPYPVTVEPVSAYITSLPGTSYDASSIWVYDNVGQYNQGTGATLNPGQAFWILMLTPATLSPH